MNALVDDVAEVTQLVWSSIAGFEAVPAPAHDPGLLTVAGSVQIAGGWNGAVIVSMTAPLARAVTANMFGEDPDGLGPLEIADAVGEVANQVGGNVKALLPGPSDLSMPAVVEGSTPMFPGTEVVERLHFTADGEAFDVTVLAATTTTTTTATATATASEEDPR